MEALTETRPTGDGSLLQRIWPLLKKMCVPFNESQEDQASYWRERILFAILTTGLLLGLFAILAFVILTAREKLFPLWTFYLAVYSGAIAIFFLPSTKYEIRASGVLLICYAIGLAILFNFGPLSGGPLWVFACAVLAGVLLGLKGAIAALIGNGIVLAVLCWMISQTWFGEDYQFFTLERAGAVAASFMLLNALAAVSVAVLVRGLQSAARKEKVANAIIIREREQLRRTEEQLRRELGERNRAENELQKREEKYRDIFKNVSDFIYVHDLEGKFLETNLPFIEEMGYSEADLTRLNVIDLLPERYKHEFEEYKKKILKNGKAEGLMKVLTKDGRERILEYKNSLIRGANGPTGVRGSARDITESILAQEALKASEEKYRNILQAIEEGYYEVDTAGNHVFFNDALCRIYGYAPEELAGANFGRLNDETDAQRLRQIYKEIYEGDKAIKAFNWEIIRKDGTKRYIEASASLMKDKGGRVAGFRGIVRDVTERKFAEAALKKEKERFQILVEESPFGVALIGKDGEYQYLNPKFVDMFGYTINDIPTGRDWFTRAYPNLQYRKRVISSWINDREKSRAGEVHLRAFDVTCKDGSKKVIRFSPVMMENGEQFVIYEDVTEQVRLESQLRQAQKMEAIGTLAGGIAHDFNNILSAIMGYTELFLLDVPEENPARNNAKEALKAAKRARDLVKQILAFSRQNDQERMPLNTIPIVKESIKMLRATLPSTIEICQDLEKEARIIDADPTQIQQVLMNLCTNAAHAMSGEGGKLEIRVGNIDVNERAASECPDLSPGPYLKLTVSDTGLGMSPEVLARIFEPYFTTKVKGSGTGLGLAVVHGIVKSYGGGITVCSEQGKGSTVDVYFPASKEVAEEKKEPMEAIQTGHERILFVDDEKTLTDIGQRMLEYLGYKVTARTSSLEALELFRAKPDEFDLVITDMTMPNMTGEVLAQEIMQIRPDIPIILCTGYSHRITKGGVRKLGIREFVMKPLVMRDLASTIRKALV